MSNTRTIILAVFVSAPFLIISAPSEAASQSMLATSEPQKAQSAPKSPMAYTAKQRTQAGPGGAKIDLSVCDLATFDHHKCLGGK